MASYSVIPWSGSAWRVHDRKYAANDSTGSLKVSGRFNRGLDRFPPEQTWPVLYLALRPEVALAELIRHLSPELLPRLRSKRLSELHLRLVAVIDCRDVNTPGVSRDTFFDDVDFRVPQELAKAALDRGVEAMLVSSATLLGDNLIVFDQQLRQGSLISVVRSVDPRLYVERTAG
jgi:RES domain-containing protein